MAKIAGNRFAFIDWARGIAALIMLQGHVFDSFAAGAQRNSSAFILSQFIGGMPPAIFLFLTGVTLAFLMESQERKELSGWQRLTGVLKRSRYLLVIAMLFRLQLWLFAWPHSSWTDLLKVDILNCMALSVLLAAPIALAGRRDRIRYGLVFGAAIAGAAPLISSLDLAAWPLLRDYLVPSAQGFPLFPWTAFLCFGVAAGTVLKLVSPRDLGRFAQWCALGGIVLVFGGQRLADLPYSLYEASDFWLNSPWLVLIKLGVALLLLAGAYLWTSAFPARWSPIQQLGTSSLLVYWVHTEIIYGRWLWNLKGSLSIPQIAFAAGLVIAGMTGLAYLVEQVKLNGTAWWRAVRSGETPWGWTPNPAEGD